MVIVMVIAMAALAAVMMMAVVVVLVLVVLTAGSLVFVAPMVWSIFIVLVIMPKMNRFSRLYLAP